MTPGSPLHLAVACVLAVISGPLLAAGKVRTCTVKVVDANGAVLGGTTVSVYAFETDSWRQTQRGRLVRSATSPKGGLLSFEVPEVQLIQRVVIVARKKGLGIDWADWRLRGSGEFTLRLAGGVALAGTVVDKAGKPVPGAEVRSALYIRGRWQFGIRVLFGLPGMNLLTTRTDAKGRFRFAGIPKAARADFYVLAKAKAKTSTHHWDMPLGRFPAGQTDIRITLADEAKVSGTVVDAKSGRPVAGVRVTARPRRLQIPFAFDEVTTGTDGTFTIGRLPGEKLFVITLGPKSGLGKWVSVAAEVEVKAGKTTRGVKLGLVRGGVLEVKVTDANTGEPVVGAHVSDGPRAWPDRPGARYVAGRCGTDGVVRMRLAPGKYGRLSVGKYGYYKSYRAREGFAIADGKVRGLAAKLHGVRVLRGVVRDSAGKPVQDAEAFLSLSDFLVSYPDSPTRTDAKGRFELAMRERPPEFGKSSKISRVIARLPKRNLVGMNGIGKDFKAGIEIKLVPGAHIVGVVTDPEGKPIAGAKVRASLEVGGQWTFTNWSTAVTDGRGRYAFPAMLPNVKYRIQAVAVGYGRANVTGDIPGKPRAPVQVEKIVLEPANMSISGVVLDQEGKPAARVTVSAAGEGQPEFVPWVKADKKGKFKIVKLCRGEVHLRARDEDGKTHGSTEAFAGDMNVEIQWKQPGSNRPPQETPPTVPEAENF